MCKIPFSVVAMIEKMQKDFLWLGFGEGKRDHLISWLQRRISVQEHFFEKYGPLIRGVIVEIS